VGFCCVAWFTTVGAHGQTPAAAEAAPRPVEQWYGLKRVDAGAAPHPAGVPEVRPASVTLAPPVTVPSVPEKTPQATPAPHPAPSPEPTIDPRLKPAAAWSSPETSPAGRAPARMPIEELSGAPSIPPAARQQPAESDSHARSAHEPAAESPAPSPGPTGLAGLAGTLAALVVALCAAVIVLLVLLRRKLSREGAIRVELVNGQLVGVPMPSSGAPVVAVSPAPDMPAAPVPAPAAPRPARAIPAPPLMPTPTAAEDEERIPEPAAWGFNPGPNYEEEQERRIEVGRLQEQAVLLQVFEDNQALRRLIEEERTREGFGESPGENKPEGEEVAV
jgi:hypothetical protein